MLADISTMRSSAAMRAFQAALGIFTLTVLIGLVNASKLLGTLSRDTILAHVHSGTLGWITMGAFGVALLVFGGGSSPAAVRNVRITAAATAAYILAFWSGNLPARAVFGTIQLLVIVAWWWWAFTRVRAAGFGTLDHPRLSLFLAFTTLVVGSTLGVLVQILLATGNILPQPGNGPDFIGGHAVAQVSGYLVLTAVGIGEWRLRRDHGVRSRSGVTQAYMLFIAGLSAAVGVLFGVVPLLLITNVFYIAAAAIFVVRAVRGGAGARWLEAGPARHFAVAVVFLVVNVMLLTKVVMTFAQAQGDPGKIPQGLIVGYDHSMFVGVMTNVLFGVALTLGGSERWRWADHAIFWLLNVGVALFVGVLVFDGYDSSLVKDTAPIMGIGALLGIAVLSMRLSSGAMTRSAPSPARP
jgi:hypothetical protein